MCTSVYIGRRGASTSCVTFTVFAVGTGDMAKYSISMAKHSISMANHSISMAKVVVRVLLLTPKEQFSANSEFVH